MRWYTKLAATLVIVVLWLFAIMEPSTAGERLMTKDGALLALYVGAPVWCLGLLLDAIFSRR